MFRILGIDPGVGRVGWGVIEGRGVDWTYVAHGCIETLATTPLHRRLLEIRQALQSLVETYSPTHAAIEELFFYNNAKTAFSVGQARGVALVTLSEAGITIAEYTPLEVKQALTGYGRAEKRQVEHMVKLQFGLVGTVQDDAADALAIALTCGVAQRWPRGE